MRFLFFLLLLFLFLQPSNLPAQVTVKGRVVFEGTAPPVETVEVKSDNPVCGNSKEVRKILLGAGQGVANAVVTLHGPAGAVTPEAGTLDQVNCEFVPHAQVLPAGSALVLTSSDAVLHNAHAFYEDGSTAFNIAVPIPGMEVSQKLEKAGLIRFRCDAGHTWMSAYILVTDSSYFAQTDVDGNFTIEGVPAGDYEIEVWQEWLGKRREPIHVSEGGPPVIVTLKEA